MASHEVSAITWVKSSYSGENGGNCVEVAPDFPGAVPVRDSKKPDGPVLMMSRGAWADFIATLR
ncbi:DUF397 domain-containing protein [Streptomyces thermospinosisporus]|uniref:DUF397 domain-containing protein n=1 Tax=Streptomyces thermospinosisporus TaxID=161482 RepID=A0ABN1Z5V5_9ACTN